LQGQPANQHLRQPQEACTLTCDWIFMSVQTFSAAAVPNPGMSMMGMTWRQQSADANARLCLSC
jgi:hypothetical protein